MVQPTVLVVEDDARAQRGHRQDAPPDIYSKLGVGDKTTAVAAALRHGLID